MNSTLLAFGVGPQELVILLVLMIFLFGPKRFAEIGKSLGDGLSAFKKATREDEQVATSEPAAIPAAEEQK